MAPPFEVPIRQSRISLQTKFILTFSLLLAIVLGCFLVYVNLVVVGPLKEKTENEKLVIAANISNQLDDYINSLNQISQRILSNSDIFPTLESRQGNSIDRLNQSRKLKDIMFQALGPSYNIQDMSIYDIAGNQLASFIGYPDNPSSLSALLETGTWENDSYMLYRRNSGDVSFISSIMDQNGRIYGYLSIQMDKSELEVPVQGITDGIVIVLDQRGQVVSSSSPNLVDGLLPSLRKAEGTGGVYQDGQTNYVSYFESTLTGWTAYVVTPKKSVLGPVTSVQQVSILLISALMIFSTVYIYFFTRNLLLPIRRLRNQIVRVNYHNMDLNLDRGVHNNELILLNEAFRDLFDRLQTSIEREKSAIREEAKARNSALQAQIAPHFIHNVLYLISIAAQEGKVEAVSEMCTNLSDSLRYIVMSPYAHVTLGEELEHTRHYLSLVQHHYEGDLLWHIEADEAVRNVRLPRLVIQPFVENCIEHAFKNTDAPWMIRIQTKLYNGIWAIEISDNGDGIQADVMKRILDTIHESETDSKDQRTGSGIGNMGIVNTVNRLKLMYPNRLFFNIFNNPGTGKGATVQLIGSLTEDFY